MSNNVFHHLTSPRATTSAPERPVEQLVVLACEAVLVAAVLWLMVSLVLCSADAMQRADTDGQGLFRPRFVQVLVGLTLGCCFASAAATATERRPLPQTLEGLPVPARTYGGVATHVVTAGESLWLVAEQLRPRATAGAIARTWPRIYRLNRLRVGPDPDLLRTGITLRLPPEHRQST